MANKTWAQFTMEEQRLIIALTFVSGYSKMKDLERVLILDVDSANTLDRLTRWWRGLSEEQRQNTLSIRDAQIVECELYAQVVNGGRFGS